MSILKIVNGAKSRVKQNAKLKVVVSGSAYFLQRSVTSIEGGSEITFTLTTSNVLDGTNVDYTITNVSPSDVISGNLDGSFTVNNNTASTTLQVSLEPESQGVNSAVLTLDNNQASVSVFPPPTYTLTRSAASIDEGSSVTFTLTTTGVANGTNVPYSISGISAGDLSSGSLTGNFVISNGSASITLTAANDALTEGSETITITAEGQSTTTTINDTSTTVVAPTYSLSRSAVSVDEGSAITFTLTTTNVANGTNVAYTITGISVEDLSTGTLTGNFVVNNNTASITLIAYNDSLTEGSETITITAAGQTTTATINDTSYAVTGPAETVLLLNGNGTAVYGDTFVDSSSNNFTITKSGSPIIRNFGPFSGGTGRGMYFDGTEDWLEAASNNAFDFGTGNYTLEAWINVVSIANYGMIFGLNSALNYYWAIRNIGGVLYLTSHNPNDGVLEQITGVTVQMNQWTHVAWSRSGNTLRAFVNGNLVHTGTSSNNIDASGIYIARSSFYGTHRFNGYISNARVLKGSALYTTTFTPPTAALTNISGTSLLLNSGALTKADNDLFLDTSSNRFHITKSGSPTLATLSPFATSKRSIYFDGSSYLTVPATSAVNFSNSTTFTVEFWINPVAHPAGGAGTEARTIISTAKNYPEGWRLELGNGGLGFYTYSQSYAITTSILLNTWTHIALVHNGTTSTLYKNGVSVGSAATTWSASTSDLHIGSLMSGPYSYYFNGYISSLRIVKGTAGYTSNFTVPTSPLTNITNTSLLLHTQPAVIDSSEKNPVIYTEGNSAMITSVKKYGTGSLYFDGGSRVETLVSDSFTFRMSPFTFETWIYPTSVPVEAVVYGQAPYGNNYFMVSLATDRKIRFWSNSVPFTSTTTIPLSTWTHVAVVREGAGTDQTKLYLNGVMNLSGTCSTDYINQTSSGYNPVLGGYKHDPNYNFRGYIDDLRITKNLARYTSNFTPPTQQLTINV